MGNEESREGNMDLQHLHPRGAPWLPAWAMCQLVYKENEGPGL